MASIQLIVSYDSREDLKGHLEEHARQQAALLPLAEFSAEARQYESLALEVRVGDACANIEASVLQVMPGVGLVVQLNDSGPAEQLVGDAAAAAPPAPPTVRLAGELEQGAGQGELAGEAKEGEAGEGEAGEGEAGEGEAGEGDEAAAPGRVSDYARRGMSVLSWPIEKLQSEFATLPMPDKIRLAKYGKRHSRSLVLRGGDKQLHGFLLANAGVSPDEVAVIAGAASSDPALLKRIASSPEWTRHTKVVRALICNPKMITGQVVKLIRLLRDDELRRLSKSGKVRAGIKREIIRYIERGR